MTSAFVSAEEIGDQLKALLNGEVHKPQVVGTIPTDVNILSVKTMANGDLNVYMEPLF